MGLDGAGRTDRGPVGAAATPDDTRTLRLLFAIVTACLTIYLLAAVAFRVGLFADGSFLFLRTLLSRGLEVGSRGMEDVVTRLPLLLAIRTGRQGMHELAIIYGVGLFAHAALMVLICLKAARERWVLVLFPLASFFLVSANIVFWPARAGGVLVSEYWSLLFILVVPGRWTRGWMWLAVVLGVLTLASFESMLFLGAVLAVAAEWRARQEVDRVLRAGARVVLALVLLGACIALTSVLRQEPGHFTESLVRLVDSRGRWHGTMVLSLLAFTLLAFSTAHRHIVWRTVAVLLVGGCAGWLVAGWLAPTRTITPQLHHDVRIFNLWGTLGLTGLFLWARVGGWDPSRWRQAWRVVSVIALTQTAWLLFVGPQWASYLARIAQESASGSGIVPFEQTMLNAETLDGKVMRAFNWGWTVTVLSVLSAPQGDVRAIVTNPAWYDDWQPITLQTLEELEPLRHYGFHFEKYRVAIAPQAP